MPPPLLCLLPCLFSLLPIMKSKRWKKFGLLSCIAGFAFTLTSCHHDTKQPSAQFQQTSTTQLQWKDVTAQSGIAFQHVNGAFGERWMPETVGSGAVFFDFDNDGDEDLFLVNGRAWKQSEIVQYLKGNGKRRENKIQPPRNNATHTGILYQNDGKGSFSDVTQKRGLTAQMYGMGVAAGDYDNDGFIDLYVTGLDRNYLFHNEKGRFRDVSLAAEVYDGTWSTSAAWIDYDRDGFLDLFVGHYIKWTPANDVYASVDGKTKSYVGPLSYDGQTNRLYRNLKNGKFADVTDRTGIAGTKIQRNDGKALGVAICDYDNDLWPDIVVANDLMPNFLFHNLKNGKFAEVGVQTGIAYNEAGATRAGMGIDAADIDHSGHESIIIGNFADEMLGLYQNRSGLFVDTAPRSAIGMASRKLLTFGVLFFDADNDSWPDIFVANGHVDSDVGRLRQDIAYQQKPLLFHNEGKGQFKDISNQSGEPFQQGYVGRGLAYADIDLDGDSDILLTTNGARAHLFRNESDHRNHVARFVLEGRKSNRSAIGALLEAHSGREIIRRYVRSGSSYLSQSELPATIGLGQETHIQRLDIWWPSGAKSTFSNLEGDTIYRIHETKGVVQKTKFQL